MLNVSIVGATAYTSCELIGILLSHPEVELIHLGGRREKEPCIDDVFPSLRQRCSLKVSALEVDKLSKKPDLAFFTLPHGVSHRYVAEYLKAGVKCVDFSGDYRLKDVKIYEKYYGDHGDAGNIARAVYGLPELFREKIKDTDLVANPGCYPTSVLIALAPMVGEGIIDRKNVIVDAKSGVSGRGNRVSEGSLYCGCNENIKAYGIGTHRHVPEMEQVINAAGDSEAKILFVPHLVPMDRGILSTIYVKLLRNFKTEELIGIMKNYYAGEKFVKILGSGCQPETKNVMHTNYCEVGVEAVGAGRAVITSAIDNLGKGAASQAVQNMNIMFGIEETLGLI